MHHSEPQDNEIKADTFADQALGIPGDRVARKGSVVSANDPIRANPCSMRVIWRTLTAATLQPA
jgi:hypothetical protein